MLNKINLYILKKFFYSFILTFLIFAVILFIGDFVEQFRKSTGKNVSLNIIFQLTLLNFLSLIYFTLPLIVFSSSILAYLGLIKGSEKIIINSVGISNFKITFPAITLYIILGIFFITIINPLTALFDERYSELEYRYIDRVDKFASITKNGLWLKQESQEKGLSSVLYAQEIKEQGRHIIDFMILEYDEKGSFQGRLDGKTAKLKNQYWIMNDIQITPKFGAAYFEKSLKYQTNIKPEDITDSLSSPTNISIWRLLTFINFLEGLGYSAIDFKMHLYDLIFLPFFMASLALLASALVRKLKQNDRFTETIIYSLVVIFIIYFISNLLDALGSTSQLNPIISKASLPLIVTFFSVLIYQKDNLKKIFQND
jgi:lipopolysaccharide export system permease protein